MDMSKPYVILDIETSDLDPDNAYITCIGILSGAGVIQFTTSPARNSAEASLNERYILSMFTDSFPSDIPLLITYNGKGFDIPFLGTRFGVHQLDIPPLVDSPHLDLAIFMKHINHYNISKDQAAMKYCNIYVPRGSSGAFLSRIYREFKATEEQHAEMLQHNAIDLITTLRLFIFLRQYEDFKEFIEKEESTKRSSSTPNVLDNAEFVEIK